MAIEDFAPVISSPMAETTSSTGIESGTRCWYHSSTRVGAEPKCFTTETVYAIADLGVRQAKPDQLAAWIRGHSAFKNKIHWARDVTYDEDPSQIRTGTEHKSWPAQNAAIGAATHRGHHEHCRAQPASRPRQQPAAGPIRHHMISLAKYAATPPAERRLSTGRGAARMD